MREASSMADPQVPTDPQTMLAHLLSLPADQFDAALGIDAAPVLDTAPIQAPAQSGGQRFLQGFSGLENQPMAPPQDFASGLLGGITRGLGAAGTRAAAQRAKLEADALRRTALRDAQNIAATRQHQTEVSGAKRGLVMAGVHAELAKQKEKTPEEITAEAKARALGEAQGKAAGPEAPGTAEPKLSDDALNAMVSTYFGTGVAPSFGMGKQGVANKTRFYNRIGEVAKGGDIDPAQRIAASKAERDNLTKLTTTNGALTAFGNTVEKNLNLLEPALKGLPDVGVGVLNAPLRGVASQFGSKTMSRFNAARQTVVNEFAKIINNPSLSSNGVLSDSARHEMETIIDPNAPVGAIREAIKTLRGEFKNRKASYAQEIADSQARIKSLGALPGTAQARQRPPLSAFEGQ